MFKQLLCWMFGGHSYYWRCEDQYGVINGWNLMATGTCIKCGHKTQMKQILRKPRC